MRLIYIDGNEADVPSESSQMTYYCEKTKFQDGRNLADVIEQSPLGPVMLGKVQSDEIILQPPQKIEPPDPHFFPDGVLRALKISSVGRLGRSIRGNVQIDPGLFSHPVTYRNELTGEEHCFRIGDLPLGVSRVSADKFYCTLHPLIYYYCDCIERTSVRWHIVESFQNAQKLTGIFVQDVSESRRYIPVADKKTLARLKQRLDEYLDRLAQ